MRKRAGVFIDVSNIYFCLQTKYKRKLDYAQYTAFISSLYEPVNIFAYVSVKGGQNINFIHALEKMNMTIRSKEVKEYTDGKRKCDLDVDITLDMVNMVDKMDICILGSADGDMAPVVRWLSQRSIETVIIASGISGELKTDAKTCIEIPPSMMVQ